MAEEMRVGSVYQRGKRNGNGDRRWVADLFVGEKANGKKDMKSFYGDTKAEAVDKRQAYYNDALKGLNVDAGRNTMGEYLDGWLEGLSDLAKNTFTSYEQHVRLHLKPLIGAVKLCKFDVDNVKYLYQELAKRGVSAAMIRKVGTTLSIAVNDGIEEKKLVWNPVSVVRKPRAEKPNRDFYTVQEVGRLLLAARPEKLYALFVLAATGGMRQGELFGIWPEDLHLDAGFLTVVHSLEEANGIFALKDTKTGYGRRIDLDPFTVTVLKEHCDRMKQRGTFGGGPIFCGLHGGYVHKAHFRQRSWIPTVERSGLRYLPFHRLRHGVGSNMAAMGEQVKVLQAQLGHSSSKTTLDVYTHLLPGLQKEAAHRLGAVINNAVQAAEETVVQSADVQMPITVNSTVNPSETS
jgi:integrase